jgi:plastocyanin
MRFSAAFTALAAVSLASAKTITINVAEGGALTYNPPSVTADVGDIVTFSFLAGNHTVTQSAFADPCTLLQNATTGTTGFDSQFIPGSTTAPGTFSLRIQRVEPVWFYCKRGNHCVSGMVGAINAPTTGNTFDAFLAKAKTGTAGTGSAAPNVPVSTVLPTLEPPSGSAGGAKTGGAFSVSTYGSIAASLPILAALVGSML